MTFNPNTPYNELPLLPPNLDVETKSVLKKCIHANRALAELKGSGNLIPNQSILVNTIPLQEARTSSEIENIVTTTDKLFRASVQDDKQSDPATKEVLRYRTALRYGYDALSNFPLSTNLLCKICGIILDKEITVRKIPGTHLRDAATNEIFYTPPEGEAVIRDKLSNLETFLHNNHTIDPLIKASIIHYQFEAIHPFHDGNGRTGRILLLLYLISQGLLHTPVLYLSRYILEHKSDYYRLIRNITEQNEWETWIIFMLTAIQETAIQTTKKILDIKELLDQTCRRGRSELSGGVYSKELIETTFVQPYCKIKFLQDNKIAERRTASKYLQALVDKGFLERITVGRDILYINSNLIEILKK